MTDLQNDIDLARRIAGGDESALRELADLYGQRLMAYALRLTGDHALAEDVVQDVLVAAWRSACRYRGDGRLLAWLLGIAHRTALKALRHWTAPITEEMAATLPAAGPSPEEQAIANERARRVQQGLRELSPAHREALELVFYQGLTLQEIAEVCGCPVGTVKSRLSHARAQLRGALARMEDIR